MKRIGLRQNVIGTAFIQITLKELDLLTDVDFMVIKDDMPYVLSMREMVTDRLDM